MLQNDLLKRLCLVLVLVLVLNLILPRLILVKVNADSLDEASIRLTRMSATSVVNSSNPVLVVLKPSQTITTAGDAKVKVTWPTSSAFTVNGTASNHTTNTSCVPSSFQGESTDTLSISNNVAESVSSGTETFDSAEDLNAGTLYAFCITGGITNPSSANAGTHVVTVQTFSGSTASDSASVAVDVTGVNQDEVTLYATVSATFNFALSGNTINMGALSPSSRAYGQVTADIDTNANNGWAAWIRSAGDGTLASSSTGDSISSTNTGSPVTASVGSKAYVVDVGITNGTGSGTPNVTSEYDGGTDDAANGSSTAGGVIGTSYEEIANSDGPGDNDGVTLESVVTISSVTKAATDYTDTWDVVGAGNF